MAACSNSTTSRPSQLKSPNQTNCMPYTQAQHPSNPPYNMPSQSSPGSSSTSEDEGMCSDLGGELLGSSSSSAVFATAGTLASCAQYLEPILRGVLTPYV
jgi:hypothetical protein